MFPHAADIGRTLFSYCSTQSKGPAYARTCRYSSALFSTTPFRLCLAPAVGAIPIRAPLPSNTHGPASFLGVMGPSCPLATGALFGLGVRLATGVPVGMGTGSDVACVMVSLFGPRDDGVLAPPSLTCVSVKSALSGAAASGLSAASSWMDTGDSGACMLFGERVRSVDDFVTLALSKDALILSTDARPASTSAGGSRHGSLPRPWPSSASSASLATSSSSSSICSQSSGSSTSASRSAAARQFGQMKMG